MRCPECGCEFEPNDSGDPEGMSDQGDLGEGAEMMGDSSMPFKSAMDQGGAASGAPLAAGPAEEEDPRTRRLLEAIQSAIGGR